MHKADELIKRLNLVSHPEGGYYREFYRSPQSVAASCLPEHYQEARSLMTSIYFLLKGKDFSAFHRLTSDELWHFYDGSSLILHIIEPEGVYRQTVLGKDFCDGAVFQIVMKAECWFAAEISSRDSFTLAGCTVAPAFEFQDFEMAKRDKLTAFYPQHKTIIERLTRT